MSDQCTKHVYSTARHDFRGHQCQKKAKKNGLCTIHQPEYMAEKRRKQEEKWAEKEANSPHARLRRALERVSELEAKVAAMEWTEVESGGMPDEEGWYLCAFSDGSVESCYIDEQMIEQEGWEVGVGGVIASLTHWAANPAHPGGE